jgi:Nuclease-related domain
MAHQPAHWPHHDQDDDPPVGLSIRPLYQLPNLDQPSTPTTPPAVPPLAGERGGSFGAPGGSAMAHYQHARAHEWAKFARSLPWRLALVIAAAALAGTLTHGAGPRLAGPAAAPAAGLVGWRLRFRVSAETTAWRRGARGERRTARHLHKLIRAGWTVLHDVAVPGSRANGNHLLIGPPGVFLVDSKAWHGHITQAIDGHAWHNGHPLDQNHRHRPLGGRAARRRAGEAGAAAAVCTTPASSGVRSTWTTSRCSPRPGCWPCCDRCRPTWTRSG